MRAAPITALLSARVQKITAVKQVAVRKPASPDRLVDPALCRHRPIQDLISLNQALLRVATREIRISMSGRTITQLLLL